MSDAQSVPPEPTDEERRWMAQARLGILEAVLRATSSAPEIVSALQQCRDRAEAALLLTAPPFSFTDTQAQYVLETTLVRVVAAAREELRLEAERLQPLAEGPDAPRPAGKPEDNLPLPPDELPRFVRLLAGPDDEVATSGGTVRLVGVELYDNSFCVLTRRTTDEVPTWNGFRELAPPPDVGDDVGTQYQGWGGGGTGEGFDIFRRDRCYPAPPDDARLLTVSFRDGANLVMPLPPGVGHPGSGRS
jgi:hypothetical protein